jgi:hypothetical protein
MNTKLEVYFPIDSVVSSLAIVEWHDASPH